MKTSNAVLLANIVSDLVIVSLVWAFMTGPIKFDAQGANSLVQAVKPLVVGLVTICLEIGKWKDGGRGLKVKARRNRRRFSKK